MLQFVFYSDDPNRNVEVYHVPVRGVRVNAEKETWSFGTEEHKIGSGIRVPEGDALWGPAMVYNDSDPGHVAAFERFTQELRSGTLTR